MGRYIIVYTNLFVSTFLGINYIYIGPSNLFSDIEWQAHLNLHSRAVAKDGGLKRNSSFLKAATTTVHHAINESEKASYVAHINNCLAEDKFLSQFLPIDPATDALFDLAKDGVLLW